MTNLGKNYAAHTVHETPENKGKQDGTAFAIEGCNTLLHMNNDRSGVPGAVSASVGIRGPLSDPGCPLRGWKMESVRTESRISPARERPSRVAVTLRLTRILSILLALVSLSLPACVKHDEKSEVEHKVVLTSPMTKDVTITQRYVCQIRSQKHINVCALQSGYLEPILIKEGQEVKEGDILFRILPTLYQARRDAEVAEARVAQVEFNNTQKLYKDKVVSDQDVALHQAKLDKANAKAQLAQAELDFTFVKARFDGIVDRLLQQQGSLIKEGEVLTTLSDNSVMWVYFNVPEARYLEYMTSSSPDQASRTIELVLANGNKFPQKGKIGAIEAKFNNETGNIPFRADFPNPDRLLRHGQTGTILIHQTLHNAIVIPQRATYEILDKRYVYVVDKDDVAHHREITIQNELDDIFVIKKGLDVNDKIVLEGVRQVHDGKKVEGEFRKPEEALANQKNHAE